MAKVYGPFAVFSCHASLICVSAKFPSRSLSPILRSLQNLLRGLQKFLRSLLIFLKGLLIFLKGLLILLKSLLILLKSLLILPRSFRVFVCRNSKKNLNCDKVTNDFDTISPQISSKNTRNTQYFISI